jgi:hypothetical protein
MSTKTGPSQQLGKLISPPSMRSPSDSGITIPADGISSGEGMHGDFDRVFRQEVAAKILDALAKGYVTHREFVRKEAKRRNLSVEQLLAAYLARTIMDKVDSEYI